MPASRRLVASLALAVFLLPALPVSAFAPRAAGMPCCTRDACRMPVLSDPCCQHATTSHALPTQPVTAPAAHSPTLVGAWEAIALDLATLASHWRVRALADTIRARPPDAPHLLNGVFLI